MNYLIVFNEAGIEEARFPAWLEPVHRAVALRSRLNGSEIRKSGMTIDEMIGEARAMLTPRLSPVEAYREVKRGALLVDIRSLEQRIRDGDVPDATVIGRNEFEWRCDPSSPWRHRVIKKNDYEQRIVVLCNQGCQSSFAAANLVRIGLRNVTDIEGGMEGWLRKGLPVVPVRPTLYCAEA